MFERFTSEARRTVVLAQQEARELRHGYIGTEHLLIGLVADGKGPAASALLHGDVTVADLRRRVAEATGDGLDQDALATIGIDLDRVRQATEATFGPGALDARSKRRMASGHIPFTKRAKKVLELSLREATALKDNHIGTGHILLGLLREGEGLGATVLRDAGVDFARLREEVTRLIAAEAA